MIRSSLAVITIVATILLVYSLIKRNMQNVDIHLSNHNLGNERLDLVFQDLKPGDQLGQVFLASNQISDEGAFYLADQFAKLAGPRELYLGYNQITSRGGGAIANLLRGSRQLQVLDLYRNLIGDDGTELIANALAANRHLTHLYLGSNRIGDRGCRALLKSIAQLIKLKVVYLWGNQVTSECRTASKKMLATHPSLERFDVGHNSIEILPPLPKIAFDSKKAPSLSRRNGSIGYAVQHEYDLERLTVLDLTGGRLWKGANPLGMILTRSKELKILDLYDNGLHDLGAQLLAKAISTNQSLQEVYAWENGIGDIGAAQLAEASCLNPKIDTLVLNWNKITDQGAKKICKAIAKCDRIKRLDLHDNLLSDQGVKVLMEYFRTHPNLRNLDVSGNNVSHSLALQLKTLARKTRRRVFI